MFSLVPSFRFFIACSFIYIYSAFGIFLYVFVFVLLHVLPFSPSLSGFYCFIQLSAILSLVLLCFYVLLFPCFRFLSSCFLSVNSYFCVHTLVNICVLLLLLFSVAVLCCIVFVSSSFVLFCSSCTQHLLVISLSCFSLSSCKLMFSLFFAILFSLLQFKSKLNLNVMLPNSDTDQIWWVWICTLLMQGWRFHMIYDK